MMRVDDTSRPASLSEIASDRAPSRRPTVSGARTAVDISDMPARTASGLPERSVSGLPVRPVRGQAAGTRRGLVPLLLIAIACAPLLAQETDRSRTEALARRAGDRLRSLQQESDRLLTEERTLLGTLRQLELAREIKNEQLAEATANARAAEADLAAVSGQLEHLQQEDLAARPELRETIVDLYKLGQARYVRLLLSVSDVRRIGEGARMVAALARRDRDRVLAAESRRAQLKASRETLEARTKRLAGLRADAQRAAVEADRAVAAHNEMITKIDSERDLNAQLSSELLATQGKLQETLRSVGAVPGAADSTALPLRPFRGDLEWPVAGTVRQRFGAPGAPQRTQNGIEIAAIDGAPVRAVHEGTVRFADAFTGFGRLVIVEHEDRTFSLYGNLADVSVARGARVEYGQELGSVGFTVAGTPGLYFELRVDGRPVDPLQWLKKR